MVHRVSCFYQASHTRTALTPRSTQNSLTMPQIPQHVRKQSVVVHHPLRKDAMRGFLGHVRQTEYSPRLYPLTIPQESKTDVFTHSLGQLSGTAASDRLLYQSLDVIPRYFLSRPFEELLGELEELLNEVTLLK